MDGQSDYPRRFGGIARLYGAAPAAALRRAHVCVVGVGGVGSWAAEALARSGIGALTLMDLDNIAPSNTNRQLHALSDQFGMPKVSAMHQRIVQINPECRVCEIEDFVDEQNMDDYFSQPFDFVIDAIDQVRVKAAMAARFVACGQAFIVSGGAGGRRHLRHIVCGDLAQASHDRLLANLRYTLRRRHGFPRQTGERLRVPCVYSPETAVMPLQAACYAPQGLSCAGYGASMLVTATFGLYCAHAAVEHIIDAA